MTNVSLLACNPFRSIVVDNPVSFYYWSAHFSILLCTFISTHHSTLFFPVFFIMNNVVLLLWRFYAAAAVANASHHPRLAALLKQNGGEWVRPFESNPADATSYHDYDADSNSDCNASSDANTNYDADADCGWYHSLSNVTAKSAMVINEIVETWGVGLLYIFFILILVIIDPHYSLPLKMNTCLTPFLSTLQDFSCAERWRGRVWPTFIYWVVVWETALKQPCTGWATRRKATRRWDLRNTG